jgi:biopolymer transport protein ExbB
VQEALVGAFAGPGAAFMYAITAVLALALSVTLERLWLLWLRWRIDDGAVAALLSAGDLSGAAQKAGSHPAARLITAGAGATDAEAAWDAMGAEGALIESEVRARVGYLAAAGNVATMLGLLGTVYGLIYAFSGLDSASAVERTARLSEGIGAAMVTTAWGLVVGIPALAAHAVVEGRVQRVLAICESLASRVALARRG